MNLLHLTVRSHRVLLDELPVTRRGLRRLTWRPTAAPTVALDLAELIRQRASSWPERAAITFEGAASTYQDLDNRATHVANGMLAVSDAVQGRVAVLAKNSATFYEVWFGAAKARKVLVPVNWRLAPAEIAYIVNDAVAEFLFVGAEFLSVIDEISSPVEHCQTDRGVFGHASRMGALFCVARPPGR
jgi:acyl-CoA synthetase (AMP-forming)/AMP-acid ligase II